MAMLQEGYQSSIIDVSQGTLGSLTVEQMKSMIHARGKEGTQLPNLFMCQDRRLMAIDDLVDMDHGSSDGNDLDIMDYSDAIAKHVATESVLVMLASGHLQGILKVLAALERAKKTVSIYVLDAAKTEIDRALHAIRGMAVNVKCHGLLGTYHDGMAWLERSHRFDTPKSPFSFSSNPQEYAAQPVPSLAEFKQIWVVWDLVTRRMIPKEEIFSKPISLRNACIFYLGHIPAFLDIHLTRATGDPPSKPAFFQPMFERGIDPEVDNPEKCHAHSEIPDEWPPLEQILDYQDHVRARTESIYANTLLVEDLNIGRALWLAFEHEVMHLETLLYMLLQSDKTLPPSDVTPNFAALAEQAELTAVPNQWFKIPGTRLDVGMTDPEDHDGPVRYFGWDIEKPQRQVNVHSFEAKARPLTNEDYARFLDENALCEVPASWIVHSKDLSPESIGPSFVNCNKEYANGASPPLTDAFLNGKYVRTVYGPVSLKEALHWPVFASYDELARCARWMGGRIPTVDEVRSIYSYVDFGKNKDVDSILTRKISAVNGHLSNEGVEISPPFQLSQKGASGTDISSTSHRLFADLEDCNVGFKNFHPTSVAQNGCQLSGRGEIGGVWEWTSSVLEPAIGYEAGKLYPAYSSDFFDGKHNVVLGGSWATHPRVAGRKTFINWYQRNYPFAWAGARLVRDLK